MMVVDGIIILSFNPIVFAYISDATMSCNCSRYIIAKNHFQGSEKVVRHEILPDIWTFCLREVNPDVEKEKNLIVFF